MKFKKAFAVILAVAMVITLMPTMAFAATTNTVTKVYKVAADETMPVVKLNLKATGNDKVGGVFDLTLDNAEWVTEDPTVSNILDEDTQTTDSSIKAGYSIKLVHENLQVVPKTPVVTAVDATSVRIDTKTMSKVEENNYLTIYLALKSGSEAGDVTVTITDQTANVTSQTVTVATVVDSNTTATVVGSTIANVSTDGTFEGNQIKIAENSVNAVADDSTQDEYQSIRLTLPKDYEWNIAGVKIGGDLVKGSLAPLTKYNEGTHLSALQGGTANNIYYSLNENGNILTLYFNAANEDYEQYLTITPSFKVGRDAKEGDVTVDITNLKGDISEASGLVVANNVVEAVEVTTFNELTTVQSGLKNENGNDTPHYVYIQLKENVKDALTVGKTIYFDFPEEVQVIDDNSTEEVKYLGGSNVKKTSTYTETDGLDTPDTTVKDASEFEWVVDSSVATTTGKDTITFKVPVSVEAGFTGDIDVTVSGEKAGVDEQTVTVGTAVNPLTIEATTNEVKTGIQNQVVSAVTLKETAKGMLQDGANNETVTLSIDGYENAGIVLNKANIKAEVTEGDIEISAPTVNATAGTISFDVKSSSSKASTIVISGFTVSMNRVAAEGGYDLRVSGDAVVDNAYEKQSNGTYAGCYNFRGYSVAAEDYLNVITPADSDIIANKVDATFVVGESQYTNNGVTVAMDVASFIQNNRTYVPVRFLANALGVTDENIAWNEGARTVTLTGANTVVKLTVGSNVITTSTGTVTADVPVIVKDNRTYLPARFVANAFGADVAWDAATRTVTITR